MTDWRAQKKAATRRSIQEHALRLFQRQGYEATTVEQIAAAAGVSHMTFFRYFPRKEAVVEDGDYDPLLEQLLAGRPADEAPLTALHGAVRAVCEAIVADEHDALLARVRLTMNTPVLRSRLWIAAESTQELFACGLARRAGLAEPDLACRVRAGAALAANGAALQRWANTAGADLIALIDDAFAALGVAV
ncbi:TetR family transcriptional regulator [[Mycobacterium] nativiensis]|uniref:TetR family transcriptional regulator n=1 Tax=[Mycobacterium] nativiensis TaxID=2855503 RepID=A0ABU5XSC8_9MYCO|nr:TetR family transcriptional regulator [Mycolicibacter sp. MYC340]MEB3030864.1 TetR family transcriptional regulator [Mycolicibacter sp. MYC340]